MLALILASLTGTAAQAAGPAPDVDPALVDAIVRKLDNDGTLDRAVERALNRVVERQQKAQRDAQAQRQSQAAEHAKLARKVAVDRDHVRGKADAEVSLIEYSDFECPFCKRFHDTPGKVLDQHAGRVNWVYRHFPLGFHDPAARREAIASECAAKLGGNEIFWKYADAVFANTQSNGQGLPESRSEGLIAAELGLNKEEFSRCLNDKKMAQRVDEDFANGTAAGVSGTPATVVRNNRTGASEWVVGAQPAEALDAAIRRVQGAKR
ncbi:MAG: DsbA family protein [Rhodocyclaceae bacterium]|nr:DsbA family protein [Rhodocyclaceae bacterium]